MNKDRDWQIELGMTGEDAALFHRAATALNVPTGAVEFTTKDDPHHMNELRVGDVLKMRVVINT